SQRHHFSYAEIERFRQKLLSWYDQHKRDLPWRRMVTIPILLLSIPVQLSQPDPNIRAYAVWISEVMLQQTQVKTVTVYYDRWMKVCLGCYHDNSTHSSRSGQLSMLLLLLLLRKLIRIGPVWVIIPGRECCMKERKKCVIFFVYCPKVVAEFNGEIPRTANLLKLKIPGVGRYTAGAIASIVFNELVPVLDGNVIRVLTRLRQIGSPVQSSSTTTLLWDLATKLVDVERPGDFNQAMMELGAICCTPKQPDCSHCPLGMAGLCGAFESLQATVSNSVKQGSTAFRTECSQDSSSDDIEDCNTCIARDTFDPKLGVTNYPVKSSKRLPRTETTAVIIAFSDCTDQHQFLLFQRPKTGLLAGLWEFPSQIVMTRASDSGTAIQSAFDTLLLTLATVLSTPESTRSLWKTKHLGEVLHIFSHIRMTYVVHSLEVCPGDSSTSSLPCRWFHLSELECAPIPTVAKKILDHFRRTTSPGLSDKTNNRKSRKKLAAQESTTSKQLRLDKFFN
ncbi:hypothetical protein P879_09337, partial [Paragonimus westermani]